MLNAINTTLKGKLWKHQAEAIDFAITRLNANASPSLIRMPTGTGKTGVIACLTMVSNPGASLILTPWSNLRDQMVDDIKIEFWKTIGVSAPAKDAVPILPSSARKSIQTGTPAVYVATFSTLNELRRERIADYQMLASAISLVIVDEGHYEPAVEWGKSVKGLKALTLLLTATPYRNDLKLFRIADPRKSVHHQTHHDAERKGIIRKLEFDDLHAQTDMQSLTAAFAKKWVAAKKSGKLPSDAPRAIVCCKGHSEIEKVVMSLRKQNLAAIGIHDRFAKRKENFLQEKVPNKETEKAEIWVHQNKLTEGLDDARFCYLALFTQIQNDRKLIQQIGRILR